MNIAKRNCVCRFFKGSVEDINFDDESFHAVTLWDVWEPVHQPIRFIDRCINLLKPGGLLAMAIPNASGWPARLFKGNWRYVIFTHLNYFTFPYVKEVMASKGLFIQKMDQYHMSH